MTDIYVIAKMVPGEMEQRKAILDAIMDDDWYVSELGALAVMDQLNQRVLEDLTDRHYRQALFFLYGVFKLSSQGLVGTYDS